MSERHPTQQYRAIPPATLPFAAGDVQQVPHDNLAHLDRELGYFGNARYVCFRYEPAVDGVLWNDGQTYGFGAGAWQTFLLEVAPLATACGIEVGSDGARATHVLVLDRHPAQRRAFFARRAAGEAMVATQERPPQPLRPTG